MKILKSLKEFNTENPVLDKLSQTSIQGGKGQITYNCENRTSSDSWNCGDTEARTRRDGSSWSSWFTTTQELTDGTYEDVWSTGHVCP